MVDIYLEYCDIVTQIALTPKLKHGQYVHILLLFISFDSH
jgi:hypothetical protein